jgi:hypothetical protein
MSLSYTTDIIYPSAFGAFQSPIHLSHTAWLGGRASADINKPFTYIDLGCGAGITLCILANCYPQAQFFGVDLNPVHIEQAKRLALDAGLPNVNFYEASFEDLDTLTLPQMDFIGLAGIYSWLSPELRQACLRFAADRMTSNGVLFLHYAALPGNAQIDVLYNLLREAARKGTGSSLQRFRYALGCLCRLRDAGAIFFRQNPHAGAWLQNIEKADPQSMAHEVLNAQRDSLSVRDVSNEIGSHGLEFIANAQLELNDYSMTMPSSVFAEVGDKDPIYAQLMLDTMRAASSRMDVIMHEDPTKPSVQAPDLWVDRLSSGLLREERRKLSERSSVDITGVAYDAVLHATDGKAVQLRQILAATQAQVDVTPVLAVQRLLALKLVHLQRKPFAASGQNLKPRMTSRLNKLLLEEKIEIAGAIPLASPVAGTQTLLPVEDRLALLWILSGDFKAAWKRLQRAGQSVKLEGKPISSASELKSAAKERASAIGPEAIEHLCRLGILE